MTIHDHIQMLITEKLVFAKTLNVILTSNSRNVLFFVLIPSKSVQLAITKLLLGENKSNCFIQ